MDVISMGWAEVRRPDVLCPAHLEASKKYRENRKFATPP